jgi:hypothetical protein
MGKRLLTKGTASAVPKKTGPMRALAPEVRFALHVLKSVLQRLIRVVNKAFTAR